MRQATLFVTLLLLCSPEMLIAAVIQVPGDQPTIQAGIDAAVDGDTVLVASGVYTGEGNRDIDFTGKAISLLSEGGPYLTIIDCEGSASDSHRGVILQTDEGPDSILSGFTIRNGYATEGGAIYCGSYCSPTLEDNIICDNTAERCGGGLFIDFISEAIVRRNIFVRNRTLQPSSWTSGGGGIYFRQSTPTIEFNTISNNTSGSFGGGIFVRDTIDLLPFHLRQNLISGNQAETAGGGVYISHPDEYPVLTGCTIVDNTAGHYGGGIYVSWGGFRVFLNDCILWGNSAPEGPQGYIRELTVLNYCDVEGGPAGFAGDDQLFWGDGNLDSDPEFVEGPLGNYYLSQVAAGQPTTSPCVDAGTPLSPIPNGTTRTDLVADSNPPDIGFHYPILPDPHLRLAPSSFTFLCPLGEGNPPDQHLLIRNGGLGTMSWAVETDVPWLSLDPPAGSTTTEADIISLAVDTTGMMHGEYQATVQVTAPGVFDSPQSTPVHLYINTELTIDVSGGGEFTAIQTALDASVSGDRLVIMEGVYTGPLNRDLSFGGKAVCLESTSGPESTIIDCQGEARGISFTSAEREGTVVRGLTIRNGFAQLGGGIFCGENTSPTLEDIHILDCRSDGSGGGLYCDSGSSARFSGRITGNASGGHGGGCISSSYASITIHDSLINENIAMETGGGVAALHSGHIILLNNQVLQNRATAGGGISINQVDGNNFAVGIIDGNKIQGNTAISSGGGILLSSSSYWSEISNNLFLENRARYGGGLLTGSPGGGLTFRNNLFFANAASQNGGGSYSNSSGDRFDSCTFQGNTAEYRGGGMYCGSGSFGGAYNHITNCLIWGNSAPGGQEIYINEDIDDVILYTDYCDVDPDRITGPGYLDWGEGNITAAPLFVAGPLGTFYLSQFAAGQHVQSPCVDAGDPGDDLVNGTTRTDIVPDEGVPDMGFHYPLKTMEGTPLIVTGPGPAYDNPPRIRVFPAEQDAVYVSEFAAYGIVHYGALVTTGELDGDWGSEIVTGAGPGDLFGPHVRGFDVDGSQLPGLNFLAYATHRFGVNVTAGDITGDGNDEIITGPGPGEVFGPHVRAFDYDGSESVTPVPGVSFFAYPIPSWGANVACGDIDGDGFDEIVTGPGPGMVYGPHVRGWDVDGGPVEAIPRVSFLAYNTSSYGAVVACGDVDGDGIDEIITGPGPGAMFGAQVRGWNTDGGSVTSMPGINFFAWPPAQFHYGVRIAADADLSGDGRAEIVTGPGADPSADTPLRVFCYDGTTISLWLSNEAYPPGWTHGTNVASGRF